VHSSATGDTSDPLGGAPSSFTHDAGEGTEFGTLAPTATTEANSAVPDAPEEKRGAGALWVAPPEGEALPEGASLAGSVLSTPSPTRESRRFLRRRKQPRHRRPHRPWRVVLAALAVILALFTASGIIISKRLGIPPPLAVVHSTIPSSRLAAGSAPSIPWPAGVQTAIAIPSLGVNAQSGPEVPQPIASLTKMMTAHVVLTDHPLSVGDQGPTITITQNDVTLYNEDVQSDQTNVQVAVGEVLTENQMLEGMLVHSASNFADLLAIWDAGSVSAFVTKMNSSAASLGMTQTQYVDASGFSTQSVSTAADQLKLATQDVANPVFDQIVDMPAVTLPVAGTVASITPLVGIDDVVGVKSGFTSAAGGCDVLALQEHVHGLSVEVLAAVVGDHVGADLITGAGLDALSIARPAMSSVQEVDLASRGRRLAEATVLGHSVPVVARADLSVLAWPGQRITESLHVARGPRAGAAAGWRLGTVTVRVGPEKLQVTVRTGKRLPPPTLLQRVV